LRDGGRSGLFSECLEDLIDDNNPVRVIDDAFADRLDRGGLSFDRVYLSERRTRSKCAILC
jgi:hypothetical protein